MKTRWLLAPATAILLAGCASPLAQPNQAVDARQVRVAPWEAADLCADTLVGDRIDYRFDASEPVAFTIGYRESAAQILPWTRNAAFTDSGIFPVRYAQRYCLTWQSGGAGAMLDYHVTIRRAVP